MLIIYNFPQGITDQNLDKMISLTEHYVCTRIYRNVFAHQCTQDEENDLEIQGTIVIYNTTYWMTLNTMYHFYFIKITCEIINIIINDF